MLNRPSECSLWNYGFFLPREWQRKTRQITFSYARRRVFPSHNFVGLPLLRAPLKGPQSGEQRGSKDNTLRKMLFLLGCRRGSLARDQRHLPVARPTEVLISIFLDAAATLCFLRRSSDRDVLKSLSAHVIWRERWDSSFRGIHRGLYRGLAARCRAPAAVSTQN